MRLCSTCNGALRHIDGWDQSARERGGNALEMDEFLCGGCGAGYRHRVSERFSGDLHTWWHRMQPTDDWKLLDEALWPTFGRADGGGS